MASLGRGVGAWKGAGAGEEEAPNFWALERTDGFMVLEEAGWEMTLGELLPAGLTLDSGGFPSEEPGGERGFAAPEAGGRMEAFGPAEGEEGANEEGEVVDEAFEVKDVEEDEEEDEEDEDEDDEEGRNPALPCFGRGELAWPCLPSASRGVIAPEEVVYPPLVCLTGPAGVPVRLIGSRTGEAGAALALAGSAATGDGSWEAGEAGDAARGSSEEGAETEAGCGAGLVAESSEEEEVWSESSLDFLAKRERKREKPPEPPLHLAQTGFPALSSKSVERRTPHLAQGTAGGVENCSRRSASGRRAILEKTQWSMRPFCFMTWRSWRKTSHIWMP